MSRNRDWWRWSMKVALASTIARACRLPVVGDLARPGAAPSSWAITVWSKISRWPLVPNCRAC